MRLVAFSVTTRISPSAPKATWAARRGQRARPIGQRPQLAMVVAKPGHVSGSAGIEHVDHAIVFGHADETRPAPVPWPWVATRAVSTSSPLLACAKTSSSLLPGELVLVKTFRA
jgi:hypothetical protein